MHTKTLHSLAQASALNLALFAGSASAESDGHTEYGGTVDVATV